MVEGWDRGICRWEKGIALCRLEYEIEVYRWEEGTEVCRGIEICRWEDEA